MGNGPRRQWCSICQILVFGIRLILIFWKIHHQHRYRYMKIVKICENLAQFSQTPRRHVWELLTYMHIYCAYMHNAHMTKVDKRCQNVSKDVRRCQKMPKVANKFRKMPKYVARCQKMPNDDKIGPKKMQNPPPAVGHSYLRKWGKYGQVCLTPKNSYLDVA